MSKFKAFCEQLLEIWNGSTPAARVGICLLFAVCVILIAGVGYWSSRPNYITLVDGAAHDRVAAVVDGLEKAGISYELGGAGGILRVDRQDYARATLIAKREGVSAEKAEDSNSAGLFLTPADREAKELAQKQKTLAETIKKFKSIESADVHLSLSPKSPFERKTSPPKASITLTLQDGTRLSQEEAQSIGLMVANAVKDLTPENVSITDVDGRNYRIQDNQKNGIIDYQLEYTANIERNLARKAESQLARFLGFENASVQVSAEYSFVEGTKTTKSYIADGKVAESETINTTTTSEPEQRASGLAGTDSNLNSRRKGKDNVTSKDEELTTKYKVPETIEVENRNTPKRSYLTVSVLVNANADSIQLDDGNLDPNAKEKVEGIVKTAVGFKEDTDAISIEFFDFPVEEESELAEAAFSWENINQILRNVSLAIAAIIALIIGFFTWKKILPSGGPSETVIRLDVNRMENVNQFGDMIREHPEVFSELVKNWVDTEEQGGLSDDRDADEQSRAA